MKKSTFILVNSTSELTRKTLFKSKDIDVLYGIMHNEILVSKGFKIISVPLDLFASVLEIDLRVAQMIATGNYATLEEAQYEFDLHEGRIVLDEPNTEVENIEEEIKRVTIPEEEYLELLSIVQKYDELIYAELIAEVLEFKHAIELEDEECNSENALEEE